jgi:hypothetical protein
MAKGHHYATVNGQAIVQTDIALRLAHVPVRSSEQIVSKALLGSHKLSLVADRMHREGFHWDLIAEEALELQADAGSNSGYRLWV